MKSLKLRWRVLVTFQAWKAQAPVAQAVQPYRLRPPTANTHSCASQQPLQRTHDIAS